MEQRSHIQRSQPASSRRAVAWATSVFVLAGLSITGLSGCISPRPSQNDCNELVDHTIALIKKAGHKKAKADKLDAESTRNKLVDECVMRGTKSEVKCSLAQSSFEDIAKNCK